MVSNGGIAEPAAKHKGRTMKLSQAIRIGAAKRPQCEGSLFGFIRKSRGDEECEIGSCAWGAGLEGAGIVTDEDKMLHAALDYGRHIEKFDGLMSAIYGTSLEDDSGIPLYPCPVDDCDGGHEDTESSLDDMIVHLNDYHEWTREAIADWLDARGL